MFSLGSDIYRHLRSRGHLESNPVSVFAANIGHLVGILFNDELIMIFNELIYYTEQVFLYYNILCEVGEVYNIYNIML